jgi:hypothetical protein
MLPEDGKAARRRGMERPASNNSDAERRLETATALEVERLADAENDGEPGRWQPCSIDLAG